MTTNIKMLPVPPELIADFDPSALTVRRSHKSKKDALLVVDDARLEALNIDDFDRFLMVLLAAVKMASGTQMRALLTCVPTTTAPIGFEGFVNDLAERFGITLNVREAVGRIHNKDAAYNALLRVMKKGLIRTILQGQNVQVRSELAGCGVEVAWMLTPLGASVLLKMTTNESLTYEDIKYCTHESQIGLDTQTHDLGVSAFLTGLCVGSAYYNNRDNGDYYQTEPREPINVGISQVVGDGHDWEAEGRKFRPDLTAVVFIHKVLVALFLEWNTERTSTQNVEKKTATYMRLMLDTTDPKLTANRPWLLFACPTEGRVKGYETAIRNAARFIGFLSASTYDPMGIAKVAVCTFEDLGRLSPYGSIYRVFDYQSGKFGDDKVTLVSLHNKKREKRPVIQPEDSEKAVIAYETVSVKSAGAPFVGHAQLAGASAPIGWRDEVA